MAEMGDTINMPKMMDMVMAQKVMIRVTGNKIMDINSNHRQ